MLQVFEVKWLSLYIATDSGQKTLGYIIGSIQTITQVCVMQYPIVYLILKRLRAPLILIIIAYSIATAGLALIPGVDAAGNPTHLTIFRAFYIISYVATTIGFGEVPYEFTDEQRLWVVFCIYLTVVSWLMAIGNILSLVQDPALKSVWKKQRFIKQVARINRKFFVICGYGETGAMLLEHLTEKGYQCVVIDNDQERINLLDLTSNIYSVPYLLGDVRDVMVLKHAGLDNENCRAVIAVTNDDRVNVKVAVTVKMLKSNVKVICRVQTKEAMVNVKSFDTEHVINPDRLYAEILGRSFRSPSIQQLAMSLLRRTGRNYINALNPPKGHWIICGYDHFGREVARHLEYEGMDFTIISDDPDLKIPYVYGKGTEAVTLRAAGIDKAVGIIAGTASDTDNFSIILTARHLRPSIFLAARQNRGSNKLLFESANIDSVMESSRLMMWHIVPLVTQPRLAAFLRLAKHQSEAWGQNVLEKLKALGDRVPATYVLTVDDKKAPAILAYLETGNILRLQELFGREDERGKNLKALPLMLVRDGKEELLPPPSTAIKAGDVFLIASSQAVRDRIFSLAKHEQDFHYVVTGDEKPVSEVLKLLLSYGVYYKKHRLQWRNKAREAFLGVFYFLANKAHLEPKWPTHCVKLSAHSQAGWQRLCTWAAANRVLGYGLILWQTFIAIWRFLYDRFIFLLKTIKPYWVVSETASSPRFLADEVDEDENDRLIESLTEKPEKSDKSSKSAAKASVKPAATTASKSEPK